MRLAKQISSSRQKLKDQVKEYNSTAASLNSATIQENADEHTIWPWIRGGNYH